jgi:hypothetical protein
VESTPRQSPFARKESAHEDHTLAHDTSASTHVRRSGLTGANGGKFTVRILTKNYTFSPWHFSLRHT